jgi:Flp pilus assembly protein TadG
MQSLLASGAYYGISKLTGHDSAAASDDAAKEAEERASRLSAQATLSKQVRETRDTAASKAARKQTADAARALRDQKAQTHSTQGLEALAAMIFQAAMQGGDTSGLNFGDLPTPAPAPAPATQPPANVAMQGSDAHVQAAAQLARVPDTSNPLLILRSLGYNPMEQVAPPEIKPLDIDAMVG